MCFLPVKCLKSCIYFSTMITIIVALTSIGFGIYQLSSNSSNFWDKTNWSWGQNSSITLIIMGAFLLLIGIFGLWGGCKRNKCCLCMYNIGTMPLFLIFLGLGIAVSILVPKYVDDIDKIDSNTCQTNNKDLKWIQEANDNAVDVEQFFGKTGGCELHVTNNKVREIAALTNIDGDSGSPERASACSQIEQARHGKDWVQFFEFMENTFECSGMCNSPGYYMYSNINNNPLPTDTKCFHKLKDFLEDYGEVTYIVAYCVAMFLLMTIIFAFCLCCHPERKNQSGEGGIYHRMSYLDS